MLFQAVTAVNIWIFLIGPRGEAKALSCFHVVIMVTVVKVASVEECFSLSLVTFRLLARAASPMSVPPPAGGCTN